MATQLLLTTFKLKLPPKETKELDEMYIVLFDQLGAGWAGRIGHYAYDEHEHRIAKNQDGYVYAFTHNNFWKITCDPSMVHFKDRELVVELTPKQLSEMTRLKSIL